jgi:uncharacterized protein (TIGR02996 family)
VTAVSLEEAFLRDIVEHPDDDAPRLGYADWLMEHGDEARQARGEFIAVQCALARDEGRGDDRERWKRRQRGLLRKHRKDWLAGPNTLLGAWEFRRGFLDRATLWHSHLPVTKLQELAGDLFRREPVVRHLHIHKGNGSDPMDRHLPMSILRIPDLPRLTTLGLSSNCLGTDAAEELAAWPALAHVRRLFLGSNPFGEQGVGVLARSPNLRGVEALDLSRTDIGRLGLNMLSLTGQLPRLLFLDLSGNQLTPEMLSNLMFAPRALPQLRALRLADANLARQHVEALSFGNRAPRIRRLDLSYNHLDDEAVEPLLIEGCLPAMEEVRLVGCPISSEMHNRFRTRFRTGFYW